MAAVLVLLCILFSVLTIEEKSPEGAHLSHFREHAQAVAMSPLEWAKSR